MRLVKHGSRDLWGKAKGYQGVGQEARRKDKERKEKAPHPAASPPPSPARGRGEEFWGIGEEITRWTKKFFMAIADRLKLLDRRTAFYIWVVQNHYAI